MNTCDAPRILVIDDNAQLSSSLVTALESEGYSVRTGSDGEEGVNIAREFRPAVVICDMHMPHANGSAVLTAMRQDEQFASSQFVLMTGDLDGTPQRVGMNLGADDYLAKPFTVDEFLHCVNVRLVRSQLYKKAEDCALRHYRETFTHSLPHEVFTPLTVILGFTEVLRSELGRVSTAEASKMVEHIHLGAERLHRTLRNYLRILAILNENIPAHLIKETTRASEVAGIVQLATVAITDRYGRKDSVSVECAEVDVPLSNSDFTTVVSELLDNACKYSLPGTLVMLRLQPTPEGLQLSVTDHGRGMTPGQIMQVGAFRQFDRNKYEQHGLGLGLTLTQHLIEHHGGTFSLKSRPNFGTTVTAFWARSNG